MDNIVNSKKEEVLYIIKRLMSGADLESLCSSLEIKFTKEEFDIAYEQALFDVWLRVGDKGYNRDGYREAFSTLENRFFPQPQKEIKVNHNNEQLTFDWYC